MYLKSSIMLLLFIVPLIFITIGEINHPLIILTLYLIHGLGMAGIGMSIMHDAIHGSYSKNKLINKLMASTIGLTGANKEMWRLQHNVLHHSFTNIENHDDDINAPFFLRFSPHSTSNTLHRYQHFYVWFFYCLLTLSWVTFKDFVNLQKFKKMGLIKSKKKYRKLLVNIISWKLLYYLITLILPLMLSQASNAIIIFGFLLMHFLSGILISVVFQSAHIVSGNNFPLPNEDGKMDMGNMEHQLHTTSNFSTNSKPLFWLLGGLTNQIEHHLFPHISHIHYKNIAPIIKNTAEEFNLPYHSNK